MSVCGGGRGVEVRKSGWLLGGGGAGGLTSIDTM